MEIGGSINITFKSNKLLIYTCKIQYRKLNSQKINGQKKLGISEVIDGSKIHCRFAVMTTY